MREAVAQRWVEGAGHAAGGLVQNQVKDDAGDRHMTTTVEVLSVVAALASAVGGAFAAWAALQSARSASKAQEAADAMERNIGLRDISLAAGEVQVEARRAHSRAEQLKHSYSTLFALSGSFGNTREALYAAEIDKKTERIAKLVDDASKFDGGATLLKMATFEEILRVQMRLINSVKEVRALREELDREQDQIEEQCAERRKSADKTRLAR